MSIAKVIGQNIELIKERNKLSNEKLGEILGVTRQTVAKYLNGEQIIDSAKLFKLASYFNVAVKDLMTSAETNLTFMFRADNAERCFDDHLALKINKKLLDYCRLVRTQEESPDVFLPESYKINTSPSLSDEERKKIREIAQKVRRSFEMEDDMDIYRVLEEQGITVYAMEIETELYALSAYSDQYGAFILINDRPDITEERKRFSCAHELGHLILHRDDYKRSMEELRYSDYLVEVREKMANQFASGFLMPSQVLQREFSSVVGKRSDLEWSDLMILKKRFGVSALALVFALVNDKLIDQTTCERFSQYIRNTFQKTEPEPMEPISKNRRLHDLLRNLVKEEAITTNKVAEMLDQPISEARLLVREWSKSEMIPDVHA